MFYILSEIVDEVILAKGRRVCFGVYACVKGVMGWDIQFQYKLLLFAFKIF